MFDMTGSCFFRLSLMTFISEFVIETSFIMVCRIFLSEEGSLEDWKEELRLAETTYIVFGLFFPAWC